MKLFYLLILAVFLSLSVTTAQEITWIPTDRSLNGNTYTVAINTDNTIFAGNLAGVHKSTDGGQSWKLIKVDTLNNANRVQFFAFKSETEIFVTTHNGCYFSSNKGETWLRRSNGLTDNYLTKIYYDKVSKILYAGSLYTGLFVSNDDGKNWNSVTGDFSKKAVNAIAVRGTGEVYIGTTSGLYRSDTKGNNWKLMANDIPDNLNIYSIAIRSNGIVFVGALNGEIFSSTDNGQHWKLKFQAKDNPQIYSLHITKTGAIFAGSFGNGVYLSNDNGETWIQVNDGLFNKKITEITTNELGELFTSTWGDGVFRGIEPMITTSIEGTFCAGSVIDVKYKIKTPFLAGNIFTAYLSDETGNFNKAIAIGSLSSTIEGTIKCEIPGNSKTGSLYKVRIIATSPQAIGSGNQEILTINALPNVKITGTLKVCPNEIYQYFVPTETNVENIWSISGGELKSGTTSDTADVLWRTPEFASISIVRRNKLTGCSDTSFLNISMYPPPAKPTITRMGLSLVSSYNSGNQWYSFGNKLDSATDKILELKKPGLYTVQAIDENGCTSPMSDIFDYNVNSVIEYSDISSFVYPNPSAGIIYIKTGNELIKKHIDIYNNLGEIIYSHDLNSDSEINEIDLTGLISGTYYLKLRTSHEYLFTKLIITK